ncbi:hypothetical protein [Lichenicoccus sp.]|uniref:hypothetical protein n=1 Tax=Lichenicoccus sp. TaxID=2781899 RepID=UPI003D0EC1BF
MSQAGPAPSQKLVTELKVSGHLMTLEKGLFCVFHAPGSTAADPQTGLPGVRITHPPLQDRARLTISSFSEDGWIGAEASAALVRVNEGPSQLLVTIYQNVAGQQEAPKLQVMRLGDVPDRVALRQAVAMPTQRGAVEPSPEPAPAPTPTEGAEVAAHVQRRGDKLGRLGEWMGEPGSQSWIEGFAIAPNRHVTAADIEYQAVLGKGWLSPWSEGGQYCGSRGMALPILGLRVRLKGTAAETHSLRVSATFTDGSKVGPIADTQTAEAESLAPLEAFKIEIAPLADQAAADELEPEPEREPEPGVAIAPPPAAAAPVAPSRPALKPPLRKQAAFGKPGRPNRR